MSTGSSGFEHDLIRRAVDGDRVALETLLGSLCSRLETRLVHRIPHDLRSSIGPEDAVQEALIEVARKVESFELRGPDSFERWVATIALRKLRDIIKRQRAAKRGGGRRTAGAAASAPASDESMICLLEQLQGPERTPSGNVARTEALDALRREIADLPEDQRRAVELVCLQERTAAEAAIEMARTVEAIHGLCKRAKATLRERLGSASRFLSSSG